MKMDEYVDKVSLCDYDIAKLIHEMIKNTPDISIKTRKDLSIFMSTICYQYVIERAQYYNQLLVTENQNSYENSEKREMLCIIAKNLKTNNKKNEYSKEFEECFGYE